MSRKIAAVEKTIIHNKHPSFHGGDTIRIHALIKEGTKERIQMVEGVTIRLSGKGATRSFTIRKISGGIGVELIYPLYSPRIAKVEVLSRGKVRRGRLYYLRKLFGRAARMKSKDMKKRKGTKKALDSTKAKEENRANGKLEENISVETRKLSAEKKVEITE